MTIGNGASDSTIQGYTLKTSKIGTRPLGLAELLIALKAICRPISLLISSISVIIIWYARRIGP